MAPCCTDPIETAYKMRPHLSRIIRMCSEEGLPLSACSKRSIMSSAAAEAPMDGATMMRDPRSGPGAPDDGENSPIEQVALTVPITDDPTLPVWTFRMWTLGFLACATLAFFNQFFAYRREPLIISAIAAQIVTLPLGRIMAAVLPTRRMGIPFTNLRVSLNPGPFNVKEHVLITIFANCGYSFGNGPAFAVGIITLVKAFYKRSLHIVAGFLIVITTQVLGYGWAGLMHKYLVEPAHMWWPNSLVQVSLFRTLHEEEKEKGLRRIQFFLMVLVFSFSYYALPGYMFVMLTCVSWLCWAKPNSVLAHQLGSGLNGLGLGSFALDWATTSAFLGSPLVSPWFAAVNVIVGFCIVLYVVTPIAYWNNVYNAKTFPIFSSGLFLRNGSMYDVDAIVSDHFTLDEAAYARNGPVYLSTFFAITYGLGFASVTATVSHVALFYGPEIWRRKRAGLADQRPDVHTRMMTVYPKIPAWWFLALMLGSIALSIFTVETFREQLQLPWWGVLFACAVACMFTLPIGIITATTNQTPGLNVVTEYMMGYILPGRPTANVCFKTYAYMSMVQAVSFSSDFKLGHYMKIPPRSMFIVQVVGTCLAATVNVGVAWWLLTSIEHICDTKALPPGSIWTCPSDKVFYDASVIWGLVGPRRIFGSAGQYSAINFFWLLGAVLPLPVFVFSRMFPDRQWIRMINFPILLGASAQMPPATSVNYITWSIFAGIFSFYVFRHHKTWWSRYNYVLSAALDSGVALMGVTLYFSLGDEDKAIDWWGTLVDHCPLATCPTQPGIVVPGCPVF